MFEKPFRKHRFGYWTLLCAVGKEQRANAKSFLGYGGGTIELEWFTNHKLLWHVIYTILTAPPTLSSVTFFRYFFYENHRKY